MSMESTHGAVRLLDFMRSLIRWLFHLLSPSFAGSAMFAMLVRFAELILLLAHLLIPWGNGFCLWFECVYFIQFQPTVQGGGWGVTELKGKKRRRGNNRGKGEHTRKKRKKVLPKKVFYFPEKRSFSAWVLWIFYRFFSFHCFVFHRFCVGGLKVKVSRSTATRGMHMDAFSPVADQACALTW